MNQFLRMVCNWKMLTNPLATFTCNLPSNVRSTNTDTSSKRNWRAPEEPAAFNELTITIQIETNEKYLSITRIGRNLRRRSTALDLHSFTIRSTRSRSLSAAVSIAAVSCLSRDINRPRGFPRVRNIVALGSDKSGNAGEKRTVGEGRAWRIYHAQSTESLYCGEGVQLFSVWITAVARDLTPPASQWRARQRADHVLRSAGDPWEHVHSQVFCLYRVSKAPAVTLDRKISSPRRASRASRHRMQRDGKMRVGTVETGIYDGQIQEDKPIPNEDL